MEWNQQMHELIRDMLHYRNHWGEEEELDSEIIAGYERRYDAILDKAQEEYEYEPPSDYYRDGYNLYVRLRKFKETSCCFCTINGFPRITPCVRGWPVYLRGNRNRQCLFGARKV